MLWQLHTSLYDCFVAFRWQCRLKKGLFFFMQILSSRGDNKNDSNGCKWLFYPLSTSADLYLNGLSVSMHHPPHSALEAIISSGLCGATTAFHCAKNSSTQVVSTLQRVRLKSHCVCNLQCGWFLPPILHMVLSQHQSSDTLNLNFNCNS